MVKELDVLNNQEIAAIRQFNRQYVLTLGILNKKIFETDLNWPQSRILMEIGLNSQITPIQIAMNLNLDKSYTSRLIKQLVKKDLVVKIPSAIDRRSVEISLTERGKKVFAGVNRCSNAQINELVSQLSTPEQQDFVNHIKSLNQLLFNK